MHTYTHAHTHTHTHTHTSSNIAHVHTVPCQFQSSQSHSYFSGSEDVSSTKVDIKQELHTPKASDLIKNEPGTPDRSPIKGLPFSPSQVWHNDSVVGHFMLLHLLILASQSCQHGRRQTS